MKSIVNKIVGWYVAIILKIVSRVMQHLVNIRGEHIQSLDFANAPISVLGGDMLPANYNPDDLRSRVRAIHDTSDALKEAGQVGIIKKVWPTAPTHEILLDQKIIDVLNKEPIDYWEERRKLAKSKVMRQKLGNIKEVNEAIDQLVDYGQYDQACRLDDLLHKVMFPKKAKIIKKPIKDRGIRLSTKQAAKKSRSPKRK